MKEIMAKCSSKKEQGVPSFEYNPADKRFPRLFELTRPLDELTDMLLNDFAGKTMTMKQIYEGHHVGKPYIKKNYKDALVKLERQGKIYVNPPGKRKAKSGRERHVCR